MYRAEKFLINCPLIKEGGVLNRLKKAKAIAPFNAKKVAKLGCSSSEKACLDFALTLGIKPVENRTWSASPHYYGKEFLIHAGKLVDREVVKKGQKIEAAALNLACLNSGYTELDFYDEIEGKEHVFKTGGLVGRAVLTGCTCFRSPWAMPGKIHWLFEKASTVPFRPLKGQLKIFAVKFGGNHA
ncbi:hypothetical protein D0S45_17550 [Marinifilum sp. JC120]|nr:hypothetical protein D0S45_17550 [Marinifilum sp. JC120]